MPLFPDNLIHDAVIFDFDGVIVDTEPLHYRAFQLLLEPMGMGFTWDAYVDTYMGFDDRDAFLEAYRSNERSLSHQELAELIKRKADLFQEIIRTGINAYPGVVALVKEISRRGIPLAISSGALRSDIEPILKVLGITNCFSVIITADDVDKSKPDPECYRLAHRRLNEQYSCAIPASRVLAIEDTPAGITAAKGAGLQVLAVTNSYPADHLSQADKIVDSLDFVSR